MAGEWIKLECATPDKPEVMRAARRLGVERDLVFGKLVRMWGWFDRNSVDGLVDGAVSTDVDALVGLEGFASALMYVGWLHCDDDAEYVSLPNFDRHNGETAKKRALKNKRQANWRAKTVDTNESTHASTREEKRRNNSTTAQPGRNVYPEEFESAWAEYPKRHGDNPKSRAFKAWNARLKEGHTAEEMTEGVRRYAQWCEATGKTGLETVKQAATFFGPDKGFTEAWETQAQRPRGVVV